MPAPTTMPIMASAHSLVHTSTPRPVLPLLRKGVISVVTGPPVAPGKDARPPESEATTMVALPGMNGNGNGFAEGVMVELPMTNAGAEAVARPDVIVSVKVVEERTSVRVTTPAGVAVDVLVLDGAKEKDPARGTLLNVIVVVAVRFET